MADGNTPIAAAETTIRIPEAAQEINGVFYMQDAKGNLVPLNLVKAFHLLEDEMVRKVMAYAIELNAQLARFKEHTLGDVSGLVKILDQEYDVKRGGTKGNLTLSSYDGTMKVQLAIADQITFGPELQSAKKLVDECLVEWSGAEGTRPEIQAIVQRAFNTDKEGLVNRAELFSLLRLEIADDRWQRAMKAIRDSIRPIGTKEYVRFYRRPAAHAGWSAVTIDLASA